MKITLTSNQTAYVAMGILLAFAAPDALATVPGALQATGSGMTGWARAAGTVLAVAGGFMMTKGHWWGTVPLGVGGVTMAQPEETLSWMGL